MTRWLRASLRLGAVLVAVGAFDGSVALAAPVQGGGSFEEAPLLRAGTYTDTIVPRETLFYAVRLGRRQRLRVDIDVDLSVGHKDARGYADAAGGFGLTFYTPLRQRVGAETVGDPFRADLQSDGRDEVLPRVVSEAAASRRMGRGYDWTGPGTYTFTAAMSAARHDLGAAIEYPMRLRIIIDGPAPASPVGPGPLGATPVRAPIATHGRRPPQIVATPAATGISDGLLIACAVVALLAGAGLGLTIMRLRRPVS